MSDDRNDRPPSDQGSAAPSSLADAVVAALASVSVPPAAIEKRPEPAPAPSAGDTMPEGTPLSMAAAERGDGAGDGSSDAPPEGTAEATTSAESAESAVETTREHPTIDPPPGPDSQDGVATVEGPAIQPLPADAPPGIVVRYYGRTDVGLVREHNEDNFLVANLEAERRGTGAEPIVATLGKRGLVLAVCDGMGGAAAGEVASQMAVDTIYELLQSGGPTSDRDRFGRRLVRAIEEAGSRIFSAAKMDRTRRGMGTTATVAGLIDRTLFVGQVGDSRAYVLRDEQFGLVTKDQSLVNQLIEAGQLTEEEAEAFEHSNIILQALGTTEEVTVDLTFLDLRRGDKLLLCSDGLSGLVHADMMKDVLRTAPTLVDAAQQLIAMANAGGGHDNITVIVAEFDGADLKPLDDAAKVAYQQYPLPPEDPSDKESAPRSTSSIKAAGAPKPGADVKSGGASAATASAAEPEEGSSRLFVFGLVLFMILVLALALWMVLDDGPSAAIEEDTTRVTIATPVEPARPSAPARDETGTLRVRSDVTDGTVWIDGVQRGHALDGEPIAIELAAGAYRVELRDGEARVAERMVMVRAGEELDVELSAPVGTVPGGEAAAAIDLPVPSDTPPLDPIEPAPATAPDPFGGAGPPTARPRHRATPAESPPPAPTAAPGSVL